MCVRLRVRLRACVCVCVFTHAVRLHNDRVGDVRENTDAVSPGLTVQETVAIEIEAVDVQLGAQPRQVPGHLVALTHGESREAPVHKAVQRWQRQRAKQQGVQITDMDAFTESECYTEGTSLTLLYKATYNHAFTRSHTDGPAGQEQAG